MPIERIVLNASPVIVLFRARLEHILPDLFKDIVIPKNVLDEISSGNDRAAREIQKLQWYDVHKIKVDTNILEWNLGRGESSVLSFALKNKQYRAVLDDMAARKCAKTFKVKLLGTGSILVLASRKGIIPSFEQAIIEVKNAGLWISDGVIDLLKKKL